MPIPYLYIMQEKLLNRYSDKTWIGVIVVISIVVIAVVALLIYNAQSVSTFNPQIYFLPKLNAFLNGSVAILLSVGYIFIRNKNWKMHRIFMVTAFCFSITFLVSYILYHAQAPDTFFGDVNHDGHLDALEKIKVGNIRYLYYFILITHILLAASIVPFALLTMFRIWKKQVRKHIRIGRWALPIWLYVSVTGVVVYLMICPYYPV